VSAFDAADKGRWRCREGVNGWVIESGSTVARVVQTGSRKRQEDCARLIVEAVNAYREEAEELRAKVAELETRLTGAR
jgi:hypothetical protein